MKRPTRRLAVLGLLAAPLTARAGAQIEEPLADSIDRKSVV